MDATTSLAGCGGVGLVLGERLVGSGLGDTWRLLVESFAIWSCGDCHFASCPVSAVRTMSGLLSRLVKEDACCIDLDPSRNSSSQLARWRAVEELARASSRERGGRLP
jgi:hypothetical protein